MPLFILLLTVAEVIAIVASLKLLGFWLTLLMTIAAMFIGSLLLRWQGLATAQKFMTRLEYGQAPMEEAWDGFCIMLAAFLFIIPGLVTDFLALLLLIPPVRRLLRAILSRTGAFEGNYWFDSSALAPSRAGVIETTYEEVTVSSTPLQPPGR